MTQMKVLRTIRRCFECPHNEYDFPSASRLCAKAPYTNVLDRRLIEPWTTIPDWCPLPDYVHKTTTEDKVAADLEYVSWFYTPNPGVSVEHDT